jgi:hypothetical protein
VVAVDKRHIQTALGQINLVVAAVAVGIVKGLLLLLVLHILMLLVLGEVVCIQVVALLGERLVVTQHLAHLQQMVVLEEKRGIHHHN